MAKLFSFGQLWLKNLVGHTAFHNNWLCQIFRLSLHNRTLIHWFYWVFLSTAQPRKPVQLNGWAEQIRRKRSNQMMVSWDDEDRGRIWAAKEAASARFPGLLRATKFGHFPVELVADDRSRLRQVDEQDADNVWQQERWDRAEDIRRRRKWNDKAFLFFLAKALALCWRLCADLRSRLYLFFNQKVTTVFYVDLVDLAYVASAKKWPRVYRKDREG